MPNFTQILQHTCNILRAIRPWRNSCYGVKINVSIKFYNYNKISKKFISLSLLNYQCDCKP